MSEVPDLLAALQASIKRARDADIAREAASDAPDRHDLTEAVGEE